MCEKCRKTHMKLNRQPVLICKKCGKIHGPILFVCEKCCKTRLTLFINRYMYMHLNFRRELELTAMLCRVPNKTVRVLCWDNFLGLGFPFLLSPSLSILLRLVGGLFFPESGKSRFIPVPCLLPIGDRYSNYCIK